MTAHDWMGGPCPVDPAATVTVWLRAFHPGEAGIVRKAGNMSWNHDGGAHDIVRYAVRDELTPATKLPASKPGTLQVMQDPVADALDDLAALGEHWTRNRAKGRMPSGIRAAMLLVAREVLVYADAGPAE